MDSKNPELQKEELLDLANRLDELQKTKNNGLGVSCVRGVISYLRRGDFIAAQAWARTDHDKLDNYPDIEALMESYGLFEA